MLFIGHDVHPVNFPNCGHWQGNCGCASIHGLKEPLRQALTAIRPKRYFEWGPGESTRVALQDNCIEQIISIEHKRKWVPKDITDDRWKCLLRRVKGRLYVEEFRPPWQGRFVLIDGRRRAECLLHVRQSCDPQAVVMLHDASRPRYHAALFMFDWVFFVQNGEVAFAGNGFPNTPLIRTFDQ